jgi:hypothetical protein
MGQDELSDKEKIYRDQIGQKATVQREQVSMEKSERLNRALCDLGLMSAELDPALAHYTYFGSAAIHVWAAPTVDSQIYIPQAAPLMLYRCPMPLANSAILELERKVKEVYNLTTAKKRSGF